MHRRIISASVSVQEDMPPLDIRPTPGINILHGEYSGDVFWAIAGIFDAYPQETPLHIFARIQAEIRWPDGIIYGVIGGDDCCGEPGIFLDYIKKPDCIIGDKGRLAKRFHKRRFRDARNTRCTFEGELLSLGSAGESDLLLEEFYRFLQAVVLQEKGRPLFLCNFLERLDEAVDLRPIFEALNATGRQVFIAVPHYYEIEKLEGKEYGATIHYGSNL